MLKRIDKLIMDWYGKYKNINNLFYVLFIATIAAGIIFQPVMHMADFVFYYNAAKIASHNIRQAYDAAALNDVIYKLVHQSYDAAARNNHQPAPVITFTRFRFLYVYPPQSLFYFMPLTLLPLKAAYNIWTALSILITVLFCWMCRQKTGSNPVSILPMLFIIGASLPWVGGLWQGQPEILMMAGFMAGYLLARRGDFFWAALLLCITSFKPQLSLIPPLYLCVLHGLPMLRAFLLAGSLIVAICSLFFGWHIWLDFIEADTAMANALSTYDSIMSNMHALCAWIMPNSPEVIHITTLVFFILSIIAILAIGQKAKNASPAVQDLGLALVLCIGSLGCPYLYPHSTLIQAISIYFIYRHGSRTVIYPVLAINLLAFALITYQLNHGILFPLLFILAQFLLLLWSARLFCSAWSKYPVNTHGNIALEKVIYAETHR